jgi:hypothetical protein
MHNMQNLDLSLFCILQKALHIFLHILHTSISHGLPTSRLGKECQKKFRRERPMVSLAHELAHGRSCCCARLIVLPASSCANQMLACIMPVLSTESLVLHPFELLLFFSWSREYASSILYNASHIHPLAHFGAV